MFNNLCIRLSLIFTIISTPVFSIKTAQELGAELLEHGKAVHLTRWNPIESDFVLEATCSNTHPSTGQNFSMPDAFRPCIYFSLNSVAPVHGNWNRSARKFAYVLPISAIKQNIINLHPLDIAVWKAKLDVKEIEGAVVFVPQYLQGRGDINPGKASIRYFDGEVTVAIESYLKENNISLIQHKLQHESPTGYCVSLLEDIDLGQAAVFESFLHDKPAVSFGHEEYPTKYGLGGWIAYMGFFVTEFNKAWSLGPYKEFPQDSLLRKYALEPYLALAKLGLQEMTNLISTLNNPEISADFDSKQKPKIQQAILNVGNYLTQQSSKASYKNRIMDPKLAARNFHKISPEAAQLMFDNPVFAKIKEELAVQYWLARYVNNYADVAKQNASQDELANLARAVAALHTKMVGKTCPEHYIHVIRDVLFHGQYAGEFAVSAFKIHYNKALEVLAPLIPGNKGEIYITYPQGAQFKTIAIQVVKALGDMGFSLSPQASRKGWTQTPTIMTMQLDPLRDFGLPLA